MTREILSIPIGEWVVVQSHKLHDVFALYRTSENTHDEYVIGGNLYVNKDQITDGTISSGFVVVDWFEDFQSLTPSNKECSINSRCLCIKCLEYDKTRNGI